MGDHGTIVFINRGLLNISFPIEEYVFSIHHPFGSQEKNIESVGG
jgi:hypothetical protein